MGIFDKLKNSISDLTGGTVDVPAVTREAVRLADVGYFNERDGAFRQVLDPTPGFNRKTTHILTPGNNVLTVAVAWDNSEYVDDDEVEQFNKDNLLLKSELKDDILWVSKELSKRDVKSAQTLAAAIKNALDEIDSAAELITLNSGLSLFTPDYETMKAAVKETGRDVEIQKLYVPANCDAQGLEAKVKVPEFKYFRLFLTKVDTEIAYDFYLPSGCSAKCKDIFSAHGLSVYRMEDGRFKVSGVISYESFPTLRKLSEVFGKIFGNIEDALKELMSKEPFKVELLHEKMFDCAGIANILLENEYFSNFKEAGVVTLKIPEGAEGFKYGRTVTVTLTPEKVTIRYAVDLNQNLNSEQIRKISDFKPKEKGEVVMESSATEKGQLTFTGNELASGFGVGIESSGTKAVLDHISAINEKILVLFENLDMRATKNQFFDTDKIRKQFAKAPSYNKKDDEGDMKFVVKGDESFRPERFVWMMFSNNERITISGGLSLQNKVWEGINLDDVIKKFNAKNTGFEAFKSSDTVRIRKHFYLKNYPQNNPTSTVLPDLEKCLTEIWEALKTLATVMGIKTQYYVPDLTDLKVKFESMNSVRKSEINGDKLLLVLKETKTTSGTELSHPEMVIEASADSTTVKAEVKLGKQLDKSDTTAPLAEKMAKEIGYGAKEDHGYGYFEAKFTLQNSNFENRKEFLEVIIKALNTLIAYEDKGSDLVLKKINDDFAAERERQRQREAEERERQRQREAEERERERRREAEARAERQRNLDCGFNYTLTRSGTIRRLQEGFTEDYPYLRIGVYMVKTGQQADRTGGTITPYDSDTTFGDIRSFKGDCTVRIEGGSTPESLEREFRTKSGLVIKICYNDENDNRYYIGMDSSDYKKCIYDLNQQFRENGYYKADIS